MVTPFRPPDSPANPPVTSPKGEAHDVPLHNRL